jgi:hypothetical protein
MLQKALTMKKPVLWSYSLVKETLLLTLLLGYFWVDYRFT